MTHGQFLEKLAQYIAITKKKTKIAKFAHKWSVIFVLLASLLISYGITTSFPEFYSFFFSSPLPNGEIVPVIGTAWSYVADFFVDKGVSVPFSFILIALLSCLLSSVTTLIYACLCKKNKYVTTKNEKNLENISFLKNDFELFSRVLGYANSNALSNILFLICALVVFVYMGCQIKPIYIIPGVFCAGLFFLLFLFLRFVYILCVKALWKEDTVLKKEIENNFESILEKLEQQRQQEELRQKQEKLLADMLGGQKIYEEAIASNPVDEELMKKAAKLGYPLACCYVGKKMLSEWSSGMYSEAEKEKAAKDAVKYFDVARQLAVLAKTNAQTECTFLWLFSRMQYDIHTLSEWQEAASILRSIKKSGNLPDEYCETLSISIQTAANEINSLNKPATRVQTNNSSSTTTSWHTGTSNNPSPSLNTYMTISGTNEFVYYKNGEYVDSTGNPVPKNRIDP